MSDYKYKVISKQRAKNLKTSKVGLVTMAMVVVVENKGIGHNQRLLSIF